MINSRPSTSGLNKRTNATTGAPNKTVASVNLYGYNTTSSGTSNTKSYNARPSSPGVNRTPGLYVHLLGQTVANKSPSSNAESSPNINVQLPGVKAPTGSTATFTRPRSAGTVMRRADGNITQTNSQIPKPTGNSVDKYRQQIVDQQLVIQQQDLQSQIQQQQQQQQQKAVPHYSTPLHEGLPSERKGNIAVDQTSKNLSGGAPVDRSCGYNISSGDRTNSDTVNYNTDDNNKMYKLRYGSSTTKTAPTVAPISNSSNISKYQPFYASIIPPNFLDNPSLKIVKTPREPGPELALEFRSPKSSSAANKIRNAIDQSIKYSSEKTIDVCGGGLVLGVDTELSDGAPSGTPSGTTTEKDATYSLLTRHNSIATEGIYPLVTEDPEPDCDRDCKLSTRNSPHTETLSPSTSMEYGSHASTYVKSFSSTVRTSSTDTFQEEESSVGLSTVPNQYCSTRDAIELRKLLMLSKGTRGGIVPSSTAVMDMYMVGKVVGVGSYGKVRAAWHRLTASKVAIKTYDKIKLKDPAHWKRVHSEIKIMEEISHPRIARMYEVVETPKRMHLIMECLDGSNLCSYVKAKKRLSEEESSRIFFQMLQAVEYLHFLGVTHRDIKLENVLFVDANDSKDVKLIDFGFSTICQPGKKLKIFCGTPSYMAPEIVQRVEYEGKAVDMWSMGILLYALLCGSFPFRAKSYPDLYRRIARGTFEIPDDIGQSAKDLLRLLLCVDPTQRVTAHTALKHPWLEKHQSESADMNILRYETTILISNAAEDDLDDDTIAEMALFGYQKDEIIRIISSKIHSSAATLYYLLLDRIVKKRIPLGGFKRATCTSIPPTHPQYIPNFGGSGADPGVIGSKASTYRQNVSSGRPINTLTANPVPVQSSHPYALRLQTASHNGSRPEYGGVAGNASRPHSASGGRTLGSTGTRPLSAYVGRR